MVNSHRTARLLKAFASLPAQAQRQAREAYRRFKRNPYGMVRTSNRYMPQSRPTPCASMKTIGHGARDGQNIVWFWIGGHEEYGKLVDRL
jgi:hypothetical protein